VASDEDEVLNTFISSKNLPLLKFTSDKNYIKVPVVYMARYVMVFWVGKIHYEGRLRYVKMLLTQQAWVRRCFGHFSLPLAYNSQNPPANGKHVTVGDEMFQTRPDQ
jgi:hypothetical protein